jgi:hypothetical protein
MTKFNFKNFFNKLKEYEIDIDVIYKENIISNKFIIYSNTKEKAKRYAIDLIYENLEINIKKIKIIK